MAFLNRVGGDESGCTIPAMDIWQLLLVGIVQGLTEFLPVSSSAHLVLLPRLLGAPDQGLVMDVAAHVGTFAAALVYFRRDWLSLLGVGVADEGARSVGRQMAGRIAIATLPVLIAGFLLRDWVATAGRDPWIVAVAFIVFGLVLGVADRRGRKDRGVETISLAGAVLVGLAQAVALVPGASRSGTTISAGLLLGLRREDAARFSFLLFLPVSAAAGALEGLRLVQDGQFGAQLGSMAIVMVASALAGVICIHVFLGFVRRSSMMPFVIYRVIFGLAILAALLLRQGG